MIFVRFSHPATQATAENAQEAAIGNKTQDFLQYGPHFAATTATKARLRTKTTHTHQLTGRNNTEQTKLGLMSLRAAGRIGLWRSGTLGLRPVAWH